MVDNPTQHFPQIAQRRRQRHFHYEVVDDVPATIAGAREHGLGSASRSIPRPTREDVAEVAARRRPRASA